MRHRKQRPGVARVVRPPSPPCPQGLHLAQEAFQIGDEVVELVRVALVNMAIALQPG